MARKRAVKRYPHFDELISLAKADEYAKDTAKVLSHTFYPLIYQKMHWNKWAPRGDTGAAKDRPIKYAARLDAHIYSVYRESLSKRYDDLVRKLGIDECVIAYRAITRPDGRGKCNIDHAKDAFDAVRSIGNSIVITADISSFFDKVSHKNLAAKWKQVLNVTELPQDHMLIFRQVTKYCYVEREALYKRLGYIGDKIDSRGKTRPGYLVHHKKIPKKLCSNADFRSKIVDSGDDKLLRWNFNHYGIAQGLPISDLLANMTMIDFDKSLYGFSLKFDGVYRRYSDDIFIAIPEGRIAASDIIEFMKCELARAGRHLKLKDKKTSIFRFYKNALGGLSYEVIKSGSPSAKRGLEYLGFRFDGKAIYIKDSTLSNLGRKSAYAARIAVRRHQKLYPSHTMEDLKLHINRVRFVKKFGRVENWSDASSDVTKWTFWTYIKRCEEVFSNEAQSIRRQFRNLRKNLLAELDRQIDKIS